MTTILEYVDENLKVFIRKDGHMRNHKREMETIKRKEMEILGL